MNTELHAPRYFFSCDWGTTSFRLRKVSWLDRAVLGEIREDAGVKRFSERARGGVEAGGDPFAVFLASKIRELAPDAPGDPPPVVVSGMASSNVGWKSLPYAATPFPLDGSGMAHERIELRTGDGGVAPVFLLSGVSTGADVMRGEETEILGLFTHESFSAFRKEALVVLPGTHSKHAFIQGGALESFQTYMTGELFEVLSKHSLLRGSVEPVPKTGSEGALTAEEQAAFLEGALWVRQHGLSRSLFRVRVRTVLENAPAAGNAWFLSGLLIGAEVNDLAQQRRRDTPILLAASGKFLRPYQLAIEALGAGDRCVTVPSSRMERAALDGHALFLEHVLGSEHP